MSTLITRIQGDTAEPIEQTLTNAAGVQDLTGAAVVAFLRHTETGVVTQIPCDITSAAGGVVTTPAEGASGTGALPAGDYGLRWRVTYADGSIDWFPVPSTNTLRILAAWE
jgi:hypothetical protein